MDDNQILSRGQLLQIAADMAECTTTLYTIKSDYLRRLILEISLLRGALRDIKAAAKEIETEPLS